MRISPLVAVLLGSTSLVGSSLLPSQAIHFADGTVAFDQAPRLLNVSTTQETVWLWGATYYFTLTLPENVGESLGQVAIAQRRGAENIRFDPEETFAFIGMPNDRKKELSVETVTGNDGTAPLTIRFAPPVPPGNTLTIGLKPKRNPRWGGTYLFGVTVFPAGENPKDLYIGVGRIFFLEENELRFPAY